jgi:hypothetical protein
VEVWNLIELAQDESPIAVFCEHNNEPLGFIVGRNFLTRRVTVNVLMKILHHGVSFFVPSTTVSL